MKPWYFLLVIILTWMTGCGGRPLAFDGKLEMNVLEAAAAVDGQVSAIFEEQGEVVTVGQVLATLDRYEYAKKEYARIKGLIAEGQAFPSDLERAQLDIDHQQIFSPLDGVVVGTLRQPGENVSAFAPVILVGNAYDRWINVDVPKNKAKTIKEGNSVTINYDGYPQSAGGRVLRIAPSKDGKTLRVKVKTDNSQLDVPPGIKATVTFRS